MAFTSLRGKIKALKRRPTQSWHSVPSHLPVLTSYHSLSAFAPSTLVSAVSGHTSHTLALGPLHLLVLPGSLPLNIHRLLTFFSSLLRSHLFRLFSWRFSPSHPCLKLLAPQDSQSLLSCSIFHRSYRLIMYYVIYLLHLLSLPTLEYQLQESKNILSILFITICPVPRTESGT